MTKHIEPSQIEQIVILGFERVERFAKVTRQMFKSYVPMYYQMEKGECSEPLNLVFNTIRAYVPNLVMQNPVTHVTTSFQTYKMYAELLGLGLDTTARQIKLKDELRTWITNALFGWGIMRVGIKATGELLNFDDIMVDNGQVYARNVSLSNFGFDPTCTHINRARCLWDRVTIPRQILLDTDGFDHDIIEQLPSSPTNMQDTLSNMTTSTEARGAMVKLQDEVDIVQMYVPEIESVVIMGDPVQKRQGKFLKIMEFNGPKEGPYVFLSFSPPVDENPFPVPPVSVWYELAKIANRVFVKMINQFENQKDVGLYNPAQVDTVSQIEEAVTGDWVSTMDPKGINVVSFGGQNEKNERFMQELYTIYNMMAGNPELISGQSMPGGRGTTATAVQALQGNASIGIEDMRDIVYDSTAEVQRRIAWYLHTDPFIELPLTKRGTGGEEVQLNLTPEQRMGDFLDYTFKIVARSMTKMDPMVRSKRIVEFCTNIIPGAAQTAMVLMQIGQQFNIAKYLNQIAFEMGIQDIVEDMFNDPEWQQKMEIMMLLGPQNPGKAGGGGSIAGAAQNKGNAMARPISMPGQEFNQQVQSTAAIGQSMNQGMTVGGY
jgi:hypothetical protein